MNKILFLVGHHIDDKEFGWEFIGIFRTKEAAIKECLDEYYFYAPVKIGIAKHGPAEILTNICYLKKRNK